MIISDESEVLTMIDRQGLWQEEKNYFAYPEERWCDMDYMAAWIRSKNYKISTSMENLIRNIFFHYEEDEEVKEKRYYALKDQKEFPQNLMVNIEDVESFVIDSGGLGEFDYET